MLSFEGIIDKITVCKKLKNLPKKFSKNYQRIYKLALFKIVLLPWQREFLTTFFIFRNSRYRSSYVAEFRDHTFQDDKIMVFWIQLCAVQSKL
jgi:hypothetical protein